ncbi:MAG TPA: adenylate/guanylate cyclase domain-containing protein [Actinomycetota bacterium]
MRNATRRLVSSVIIAVVLAGLSWLGVARGAMGGTQLRLTDGLFPGVAPSEDIVVVQIDDASLAAVGDREQDAWPWERDVHAQLIEGIAADGAELIGYDVTFSEPGDPEADAALAEAIGDVGGYVQGVAAQLNPRPQPEARVLRADGLDLPIAPVAGAAAALAHVNVRPDPDGVARSLPLLVESPDGDLAPALSLVLYQLREGLSGPYTTRPEGVEVGGRLIPTGRQVTMDVNFAGGRKAEQQFTAVSAVDVLDDRVPAGTFDGKIVLVGATAIGLGDTRLTPLDKAGGQPGVLVHANALNTMLQGAFLEQAGTPLTAGIVFLVALLVALAVAFLRAWLSPLVTIALGVSSFLFAFRQFDRGTVMNLVYPPLALLVAYLAALAFRYVTEVRERRRVTQTFSRYVAEDIVQEVLAAPEVAMATLRGASRPLSILFADLRGFTSASEGAAPENVVAALNVYLDAMTRAVNEERGTIDKFMGDCVMAFWGAPRAEPEHAAKSVRSAMRMLDEIDKAVAGNPDARHLQVAGCGVGIATGPAVVGNIGSHERLDYTVIGDTVNTASRLCGVADAGQIVVTEETAAALGDGFRVAPLPPLKVKGKKEPLTVLQVLREGQEASTFAEGATLDATEDKGSFEPVKQAPPKAAGYSPIEPKPVDE